jgi:hypothetical protein
MRSDQRTQRKPTNLPMRAFVTVDQPHLDFRGGSCGAGKIPDSAVPDDLSGNYRAYLTAAAAPRERQFPLDMDVVDFGG